MRGLALRPGGWGAHRRMGAVAGCVFASNAAGDYVRVEAGGAGEEEGEGA